MMNNARLNVALQGVGLAEAATQRAVAYAEERRQNGKAIAEHPDVRRMLLRMRALTTGARSLVYYAFGQADRGARGDENAALRAEVLTPLCKAWGTDIGCEVSSLGIQVHGGMGFIEETGAAQHLRDARIAPIYEGTNGIQAADLVGASLASMAAPPLTCCSPTSAPRPRTRASLHLPTPSRLWRRRSGSAGGRQARRKLSLLDHVRGAGRRMALGTPVAHCR
jgi:hypothetical protein